MVAENKIGESEPATLPEAIMAKLPFGKFHGKCVNIYRSGTVNSNTVNSKFHYFEVNLTGI